MASKRSGSNNHYENGGLQKSARVDRQQNSSLETNRRGSSNNKSETYQKDCSANSHRTIIGKATERAQPAPRTDACEDRPKDRLPASNPSSADLPPVSKSPDTTLISTHDESIEDLIDQLSSHAKQEQIDELWYGIEQKELAQWTKQVEETEKYNESFPSIPEQKRNRRDFVKLQVEKRQQAVKKHVETRKDISRRLAAAIRGASTLQSATGLLAKDTQRDREIEELRSTVFQLKDRLDTLAPNGDITRTEPYQTIKTTSAFKFNELQKQLDDRLPKIVGDFDGLNTNVNAISHANAARDERLDTLDLAVSKLDKALFGHKNGQDIEEPSLVEKIAAYDRWRSVQHEKMADCRERLFDLQKSLSAFSQSKDNPSRDRSNDLSPQDPPTREDMNKVQLQVKGLQESAKQMVRVVNDAIPTLQAKVAQLTSETSTLQQDIRSQSTTSLNELSLQGRDIAKIEQQLLNLTDLSSKIQDDLTKLTDSTPELSSVRNEVTELRSLVNDFESKVSEITKIQDDLKKEIGRMNSGLQRDSNNISAPQTPLQPPRTNILPRNNDSPVVGHRVASANRSVGPSQPPLSQSSAAASPNLANLAELTEVHSEAIRSLQSRYDNLTTDHLARQMLNQLHPVGERLVTAETGLAELHARAEDLNNQFTSLNGDTSGKLSNLIQDYNNLRGLVDKHTSQLGTLDISISDVRDLANTAIEDKETQAGNQLLVEGKLAQVEKTAVSYRNITDGRLNTLEESVKRPNMSQSTSNIISPPAEVMELDDTEDADPAKDTSTQTRRLIASDTDDDDDIPRSHRPRHRKASNKEVGSKDTNSSAKSTPASTPKSSPRDGPPRSAKSLSKAPARGRSSNTLFTPNAMRSHES